jgi:hypothetical protein
VKMTNFFWHDLLTLATDLTREAKICTNSVIPYKKMGFYH